MSALKFIAWMQRLYCMDANGAIAWMQTSVPPQDVASDGGVDFAQKNMLNLRVVSAPVKLC